MELNKFAGAANFLSIFSAVSCVKLELLLYSCLFAGRRPNCAAMDEGLGVQSVEDFWGTFVLVLCVSLRGLMSCA